MPWHRPRDGSCSSRLGGVGQRRSAGCPRASARLGERVLDRVVGGLAGEVVPQHSRRGLTGEGHRHPRVLVQHAPQGERGAALDGERRLGHAAVVVGLLLELLRRRRLPLGHIHAHVELGDGCLQPEVGEPLEVVGEVIGEPVAQRQVPLGGEAVDRDAVGEEVHDERVVGVALGVDAIDVVVVEEQQRLRIGLVRPTEAVGDDLRAQLTDPDVPGGAQLGVVIEDLIDDVPLLHAARVATGHREDVVPQDLAQLLRGVVALLDPFGVLAVPHQGVSAHHLAVGLGEVRDRVGVGEVVGVRRGAQVVPLHLVLGRERGELAREHLAVGLVAGERIRVVHVGVVPTAGDSAADLQRVPGGEGEVVLLDQSRWLGASVPRRRLRPSATARSGDRCRGDGCRA